MGYRITNRVVRVQLRGTEFDGAELRADVPTAGEIATATAEGTDAIITLLGTHLLDWTLEDGDGNPLDCTAEGLQALPADLARSFAIGYLRAASRTQFDRPTPPSAPELNGSADGTVFEAL